MPISPLSLWNKPNVMFKSNTSVDEIFFFPYCILSSDTRSWLLLLDDSTDTFLEAPVLLLSCHCCSLSFVKAATENWVCRKEILPVIYSLLTARICFSLVGPFFPPSASIWQGLKDQISSFKAKTIYIFRDQNPQPLKALLSVYTIISGTFPPATINYVPLSIIKLILLILATNSKRPLSQASLDALKLKLLMCNRWLMLTCCYYLLTKEVHEKSFMSLFDTKHR